VKNPPFNPEKVFQRALAFHHEGKLKEAESLYQTLMEFFPKEPGIISIMGTLLLQKGNHEEGVKLLLKSLSLNPHQADVLYNLGIEYQNQAKYQDALDCYDRSIKLNSSNPQVFLNKGNTLKDLKRFNDSISSYDQAIKLAPSLASAYWNKALTKIHLGEYEEGWRLYEWGWQCGERGDERFFTKPKWLGETSIKNKTILIVQEQGYGDFIQFARYIPLLKALGANVIVQCSDNLAPLISTIQCDFEIVNGVETTTNFDMYCPVVSLPLAFKTTLEKIPNQVPYLFTHIDKKQKWQEILGEKKKPRIGIAWSGSLTNKIDNNLASRRNIPLQELRILFDSDIDFHVIQREIRPEDLVFGTTLNNLHFHQDQLLDFSETAALIQEMDLVISTCTSIAHLSGALNKETIVMLPYSADYRWMESRIDSPWYPSVRLIRQTKIGDWTDAILQLSSLVSAKFKTRLQDH
jgi:Tetratricopeptide repeat